MKVYISGPMTGLPDMGRNSFAAAEKKLRDAGHVVLNPGVLPVGLDPADYMPICLAMLQAADAIYMLAGFMDSLGAVLELRYAQYQGIGVYYEGKDLDRKMLFKGAET